MSNKLSFMMGQKKQNNPLDPYDNYLYKEELKLYAKGLIKGVPNRRLNKESDIENIQATVSRLKYEQFHGFIKKIGFITILLISLSGSVFLSKHSLSIGLPLVGFSVIFFPMILANIMYDFGKNTDEISWYYVLGICCILVSTLLSFFSPAYITATTIPYNSCVYYDSLAVDGKTKLNPPVKKLFVETQFGTWPVTGTLSIQTFNPDKSKLMMTTEKNIYGGKLFYSWWIVNNNVWERLHYE